MSLLGGLEGVDMNDPDIQAMLASLQGQGQPGEKKDGEGKK
jgi:hypothetical protein